MTLLELLLVDVAVEVDRVDADCVVCLSGIDVVVVVVAVDDAKCRINPFTLYRSTIPEAGTAAAAVEEVEVTNMNRW